MSLEKKSVSSPFVKQRALDVLWIVGGLYFGLAALGGFFWGHEVWRLSYPYLILVAAGLIQWKFTRRLLPDFVFDYFGEPFLGRVSKRISTSVILGLVGVVYILTFGFCGLVRSLSFDWNAFDLSYIDAAIYSTAKGYGFLATQVATGGTYLGEHFSPILAVLAPFYWIFDSSNWLFFFQPSVVALVAIFFFYWVKKKYSGLVAWLVVLFVLTCQPVVGANEFNFREDYFFLIAGAAALFFYSQNRLILLGASLVLALFIKESAPLLIFSIGCLVFLEGRKRLGFSIIALGLVSLVVVNQWVTPMFVGSENTVLKNRLPGFSDGVAGFLILLRQEPLSLLKGYLDLFFSLGVIKYLFKSLVIFLPLIVTLKSRGSWYVWISLLPMVGANILIRDVPGLGFHYELITIPILTYLVAKGLHEKSLTWKKHHLLALVFIVCFFDFGFSPLRRLYTSWPTSKHLELAQLLDQIPSEIRLASTTSLLPRLHHRRFASIVGLHDVQPDVIVLSPLSGLSHYGTEPPDQIRVEYLSKGWNLVLEEKDLLWILARPGISSDWVMKIN